MIRLTIEIDEMSQVRRLVTDQSMQELADRIKRWLDNTVNAGYGLKVKSAVAEKIDSTQPD